MLSLPFLLPFHQLPIPSFHSEWLALLLGLAGVLALLWRHESLRLPRIAAAPLALMLLVLLQLCLGMFAYTATALTLLVYLLWSALLLLAGGTLGAAADARRVALWLAWSLLVGGVCNAVFGLAQYAQVWPALDGIVIEPPALSAYGVYGNLAQQNHFAMHMALAIGSACYLYAARRLSWAGAVPLCAVLAAALFLSASKSAYLYVAWIALAAHWWGRRDSGLPRTRRAWLAAFGVTAFAIALAVAWLMLHPARTLPQIDRWRETASAVMVRGFLWKHALLMFLDHPLLGVGFDAFAWKLIGQLDGVNKWGVDQFAHNLVLQLLAVGGLCGAAALLVPFALFIRRQCVLAVTPERMWGRTVVGLLLVHSMLEQPLFYAYFLGPMALVAGMMDGRPWQLRPARTLRWMAACVLVSGVSLLLKTAYDFDRLEGWFYSERYAGQDSPQQSALRRQAALDLHRFSIFTPVMELRTPDDFVSNGAASEAKLAFNERVMHFAPIAETEYRHAALLASAHRVAEAQAQCRRAALAYPNDVGAYGRRFDALAQSDPATYAALAAYCRRDFHRSDRTAPSAN